MALDGLQLVVVSNNTCIERCDGWLIGHMLVDYPDKSLPALKGVTEG
jgi:hypothetical protein